MPVESADKVREAMSMAGAGEQGNYKSCSFSCRGVGRFLPGVGARPALGKIGEEEEVEEELLEMICREDKVEEVIRALKSAHPYEEPAIDIMERLEMPT